MDIYGKSLTGSNVDLVIKIPSIEYRYLFKNYKFLLELNKDIKILEVGPGVGYFTQFLLNNGYKNIDIVELSGDFYTSQKNAFKNYSTINFYNEDIIDFLKNTDKNYDIIISRQVVEHLNEDLLLDYFNTAFSHLNIGGKLISETINSQNFIYSSFLRYIDITHKLSFSSDMIKQIFNLISFGNDKKSILGVKQLNLFDFIFDRFNSFDYQVDLYKRKLDVESKDSIKLGSIRRTNIIFPLFSQIFRDFARFISELLSLFFFYKRAYKNIGTEFILFIFEKGKK